MKYTLKDYQLLRALGDKHKYNAKVDEEMLEEWAVNFDELTLLTLQFNSDSRLVLPPLQRKSKKMAQQLLETAQVYLASKEDDIDEIFVPVHKGNHWVLFHLQKDKKDWDLTIIDSMDLTRKKNKEGIRKTFHNERHFIAKHLGIKINSWEYPKPTIIQSTALGCGIVLLLNLVLRSKEGEPKKSTEETEYPKWTSGEKWLCGLLFFLFPPAGLGYLIYKAKEIHEARVEYKRNEAIGKNPPIKVEFRTKTSNKLSKPFEMSLRMQAFTYLHENKDDLLDSLNQETYPFLTDGMINSIKQSLNMLDHDHKGIELTYENVGKKLGGKNNTRSKKPKFDSKQDNSKLDASYRNPLSRSAPLLRDDDLEESGSVVSVELD